MFDQVFYFAGNALSYPLVWFTELFQVSTLSGLFLTFFLVYQVTRLLIFPLLGRKSRSLGSDTVRRHDHG